MGDQVLSIKMKKKDGKLTIANALMVEQFRIFVSTLKEEAEVSCLFELNTKDNTKAQLAKIHVMIKEIADEQGQSMNESKKNIKQQCGLSYKEDGVIKYKSFADCSKSDLSTVIENIIQIGVFLNINFQHLE